MTCRSTPAGSAFTTYARLATGSVLTDPQTLSVFHELRATYQNRPENERRVYTADDYQNLLGRQMQRVRNNTALTEARRASLLERLQRAQSGPVPDQSILYALHNITPTVRTRGERMTQFQTDIAMRLGISVNDVARSFQEYADGIDRSRSAANPSTFTSENRALSNQYGLGREVGVVHAVAMLTEQAEAVEIARVAAAPQRIERQVLNSPTDDPNVSITEAGFDPRNGRLEVVTRNVSTGETTSHAYHGVRQNTWDDMRTGRGGRIWSRDVRGRSEYAYANRVAAAQDGAAPRCATCGQYANASHACPARVEARVLSRWGTSSRWSRQPVAPGGGYSGREVSPTLPAIREFRTAFETGPVSVSGVYESLRLYDPNNGFNTYGTVRGDFTASRNENNEVVVDSSRANCSCVDYRNTGHCIHVDLYAQAVRTRLDPPPRSARTARTPEERERLLAEAQRRAETAAASDWTRNEAGLAEARANWAADSEVVYSEDFSAFEEDYNSAVAARAANGDTPVIPLIRENALNGMAQRGSGVGFGMEIEYEFPSTMDYNAQRRANAQIGQQLYDAGLTYETSQMGYGASKRRGFQDTHERNWSWERDGSVNGGELVTPVMYDEPATWEYMEKAVDILRRNGAVPTKKAGAHVHVSTGNYAGDPTKYTELARMMTQHEDVVFRLAAEPKRGTHRLGHYTEPNPAVAPNGFANMNDARRWQGGRTKALNLQSVQGGSGDHVEFRVFDSTLDAGAMQSQIKLAVAMTQAAPAVAAKGGTTRSKEQLGAHAQRAAVRGRRRLTSDDLKEDTATLRSLLDTLFTRREDKAQLTAVFANTKWAKRGGRS